MPSILFVATAVKEHINAFHVPCLHMLGAMGWKTAVAAHNDYERPEDCVIPGCDRFVDLPFTRSPLTRDNLRAYRTLKRLISENGYDVIHCHTPAGAAIARMAARKARKEGARVIYTAHGFHFYKGAPLMNWLLYYPVERLLSRLTDALIVMNGEDAARARAFHAGKTYYVPGVGVDTARFAAPGVDRAQARRALGLAQEDFALITAAELIPRKNIALALRALALLKSEGTGGRLRYFVCGQGGERAALEALARELGLKDDVRFLGYRADVPALLRAGDAFLLPSRQEGLPVAVMEAMASGLPVVGTRIRGMTDLIQDGENGLLVEQTPEAVAQALRALLRSADTRALLGSRARESARRYDKAIILAQMKVIYEEQAALCAPAGRKTHG